MTHSVAAPPDQAPAAPAECAVYLDLHTDHYPWTEVNTDLNVRQSQEFSGLLDLRQGPRWARFVWARGQLLGGHTRAGQEVTWASTMQALPRARVSLYQTPAAVAQLAWSCRAAPPKLQSGSWDEAQARLARTHFSGLVVSEGRCLYWQGGRTLAGQAPEGREAVWLLSPYAENDREGMRQVYEGVLRAIDSRSPLTELWPGVAMRLAGEHPSLDPFSQEISWRGRELRLDPEVPVTEFRAAMQAALRTLLGRTGLRLSDLDLGRLPDDPMWAAAGLEGL